MRRLLTQAPFFLAFGSAASILFSIAVSQILLALALAALLVSGRTLQFPPLRAPLAALFAITLAAVLASADPRGGLPQIRKFFVFAILLVVYSTFESVAQARALFLVWAGIALISGGLGMLQFLHRRAEFNTYDFLQDGRITGLASHWMTFGGEEMIALLMLAALVLFSRRRAIRIAGWPVLAGLVAAVALGMTRSVFLLGVPLGLLYLLWQRRRVLVVPAVAAMAAGVAVAPGAVRERAVSIVRPRTDMDANSNSHRAVCRAVGWEMVKAHPWLGLGPEQIARQFERYVPASVPRPLPRGWYGHLHNIYFQYAAERGVFGLLCVLWLIAKAANDFQRHLRRPSLDPDVRAILHGAIAVIVAILAEGCFEYNLGDSEVLTLFLATIACAYAALRASTTDLTVQSLADFRGESGRCERLGQERRVGV